MDKTLAALTNLAVSCLFSALFGVTAFHALRSAWIDNPAAIALAFAVLIFVLSFAIIHGKRSGA